MKALKRTIVITGASSGIGKALASIFASPEVLLILSGRNLQRLEEVAQYCRELGAQVECYVLDVRDRESMRSWLEAIDSEKKVDLVIANAGISGGLGGSKIEDSTQINEIFAVNLFGVLNTIEPLLPRMIERGQGQIAIMSSLAGFRGFPGAPAYAASKAAVRIYGESLASALSSSGVKVHVICPGFVVSPMTDSNDFKMPFLINADKAAQIIKKGIDKGYGRIAFPWQTWLIVWFLALLPDCFANYIVCRTPSKSVVSEE